MSFSANSPWNQVFTFSQVMKIFRDTHRTMPAGSRVYFDYQIAEERARDFLTSLNHNGEGIVDLNQPQSEFSSYIQALLTWPTRFDTEEARDEYFEGVEHMRKRLLRVPMTKTDYLQALEAAKTTHDNPSVRPDFLRGMRLAKKIIARIPEDTILNLNADSAVSRFLAIVLDMPRVFHGYTRRLIVKEQRYFGVMERYNKAAEAELTNLEALFPQGAVYFHPMPYSVHFPPPGWISQPITAPVSKPSTKFRFNVHAPEFVPASLAAPPTSTEPQASANGPSQKKVSRKASGPRPLTVPALPNLSSLFPRRTAPAVRKRSSTLPSPAKRAVPKRSSSTFNPPPAVFAVPKPSSKLPAPTVPAVQKRASTAFNPPPTVLAVPRPSSRRALSQAPATSAADSGAITYSSVVITGTKHDATDLQNRAFTNTIARPSRAQTRGGDLGVGRTRGE